MRGWSDASGSSPAPTAGSGPGSGRPPWTRTSRGRSSRAWRRGRAARRGNSGSRRRLRVERFAKEDAGRVLGPAGQLAQRLVPESTIEAGRLEAVGVELHLGAAAPLGLAFGGGEEARAQSLPSPIL